MTNVKEGGRVEFRFFCPGVANVRVSGDFNGGVDTNLDMHPECDGWWYAEAKIDPGEYRFCYVADGRWFTDFAANGFEPGQNDRWNSVLRVPPLIDVLPER